MTVNATVDNKNKQIGSAADMQRTIDTELNIFVFVILFQGYLLILITQSHNSKPS